MTKNSAYMNASSPLHYAVKHFAYFEDFLKAASRFSGGMYSPKYILRRWNQMFEASGNSLEEIDMEHAPYSQYRILGADFFASWASTNLLWFDRSGQGWRTNVRIEFDDRHNVTDTRVSPWVKLDQYIGIQFSDYYVLNSGDELDMILLSTDSKTYAYMLTKEPNNGVFTATSLLMAPQIRLLDKWGFKAFCEDDGLQNREGKDYDAISKFTRPGSALEECFCFPACKPENKADMIEAFKGARHPREWQGVADAIAKITKKEK